MKNGAICEKSKFISRILLHPRLQAMTLATVARGELTRGVWRMGRDRGQRRQWRMIGTGVFLKTRVMTCNVGSAKTVLLV